MKAHITMHAGRLALQLEAENEHEDILVQLFQDQAAPGVYIASSGSTACGERWKRSLTIAPRPVEAETK